MRRLDTHVESMLLDSFSHANPVLSKVTLRAYLAGPDVFLPQAGPWAEFKKAICARHGLIGVSPFDALTDEPPSWAALP